MAKRAAAAKMKVNSAC